MESRFYIETRAEGSPWTKFTLGTLTQKEAEEHLVRILEFAGEKSIRGAEARIHEMTETEMRECLISLGAEAFKDYLMRMPSDELERIFLQYEKERSLAMGIK